jgi:hypothetical protein
MIGVLLNMPNVSLVDARQNHRDGGGFISGEKR